MPAEAGVGFVDVGCGVPGRLCHTCSPRSVYSYTCGQLLVHVLGFMFI